MMTRSTMRLATRLAYCGLWMAVLVGLPAGAGAQPASTDQLIAAGAEAGADPALMEQVVQRAQQAGYAPEQTALLLRPAVGLAQDGLPADGVLQKALEGLAKQVPPPRIQPVLGRIQTSTQQAAILVNAWAEKPAARAMMRGTANADPMDRTARHDLIRSAAQAEMQDVSPEVVRQLLETLPSQTQRRPIPPAEVSAAVQVLPEVMRSGTSAPAAIELLTSAMDAGYGPTNVRQLPTAMQAARQQSQRPMDALARGAARAIAQGTPAADVLSRLFDGGLPGAGGPPSGVGPPNGAPGQGGPPNGVPPSNGPPTGPPGQGGPGQGSGPPSQGGPPGQSGSSNSLSGTI